MTEHDDLDGRLARWFEADGVVPVPAGRFQQTIEATRNRRPRSELLAGPGSHWVGTGPAADAPRVSWGVLALVALIALALAAGAVFVGSQRNALPAITLPGGSGLIAYSFDGDIYVGDPTTGETRAIVIGLTVESSPTFSPDGSLIAFRRGDELDENASIVVVRADGSDERVAMPPGYSQLGTGFTWTPDGGSLLVNHDSKPRVTPYFDGELSLLDASGATDPRLITPPLPTSPGGPYFGSQPVAPMFRPPNGDAILAGPGGRRSFDRLYLWDVDLESRTPIVLEALEPFKPYRFTIWDLWWAPDGSRFAFGLIKPNFDPIGIFVMDADGTNLRPLTGVGGSPVWSPDGSKIAYQRGCPDPEKQGALVVIHDVASSAERVLHATTVDTKYEGNVSPVPPNGGPGECFGGWIDDGRGNRAWDYEGWSWSPDGQSIVMLERSGTRPKVVDIETGEASELPWEADSAPSWQRVAPANPE